ASALVAPINSTVPPAADAPTEASAEDEAKKPAAKTAPAKKPAAKKAPAAKADDETLIADAGDTPIVDGAVPAESATGENVQESASQGASAESEANAKVEEKDA
ncbi:MAG: hypothetical protein Q7T55_01395, partial [Solirubrobacteraceae bacterium]|nr:hypothetical protein [Solirubrobacteraceae bacterium]